MGLLVGWVAISGVDGIHMAFFDWIHGIKLPPGWKGWSSDGYIQVATM